MSKRLVRILVPIIAAAAGLGIVSTMLIPRPPKVPAAPASEPPVADADPAPETEPDAQKAPPSAQRSLEGLAVAEEIAAQVEPIGSLDPEVAPFLIDLTNVGAGIERITFSDIWETAKSKRAARVHAEAVAAGEPDPPPLPPIEERYVLARIAPFTWLENGTKRSIPVPVLAAHSVRINGNVVELVSAPWRELPVQAGDNRVRSVAFGLDVVNAEGEPIVRLTRRFEIGSRYDLLLEQAVENLSGGPLEIRWVGYGPNDLSPDRSRYMDRRRFRFGYELSLAADPGRMLPIDSGKGMLLERGDAIKADDPQLWPNEPSAKHGYRLAYFASTNRYFALVIHPAIDDGTIVDRALAGDVERILKQVSEESVFTGIYSPTRTLAAGATTHFDLGVYAGPQDPRILGDEPLSRLNLDALILYQMSDCCAMCTFQWLAHGLLWFLTILHDYVVFDWGIAIIVLVLVVRALLHPITRRSQISMQRFSRSMSAMKPEMDRLQKKFKDEPKKLQQEQLRMMREHGTNPLQALGCLPLFLQTPIWFALYAALYFAYQLYQQPAFFGIFQDISFGHWQFLADLSSPDHCFWVFDKPLPLFGFWNITGINLLPFLMGLVFFFQQKYLAPPPSPTMTEDQIRQQRIMKFMTVVMFPIMLYSAPSGLTLYIMTSSSFGILEGWYIRTHLTDADLSPKKKKQDAPRARKPWERRKPKRDAQGRAYEQAVDRLKNRKGSSGRGFKKRK